MNGEKNRTAQERLLRIFMRGIEIEKLEIRKLTFKKNSKQKPIQHPKIIECICV